MRGKTSFRELIYAAGAHKNAFLRPNPPRDHGRDAFLQDHSGNGHPAMSARMFLI